MWMMKKIGRWGSSLPGSFFSLGVLLGAFYWFLDAAIEAFVLHEGDFYHTVFFPHIDDVWMRLATAALLVFSGGVAKAIVAQRSHAEEELRESEQRLRSLIESGGEGILAYDTDLRITLWNPAMERISGLRAEELLGRPLFEAFPFLHEVEERDAIRDAIRGQNSVRSVMPYRVPETGRAGYFESSHFPVYDAQGQIIGGMGVIRDVTDRARAEEALRESEARYQDLYDNAPDMFVSVDAKTATILQANQTLARVMGYTREELIGRPLFDLCHPDGIDGAKEAFRSFLSTGKVQNVELQLSAKDGTRIEVSLNASAIRDEERGIRYSRSVLRDITELKRAERERRVLEARIQQAQKSESLAVLAGGIAHDFNNLLVSVLGNAELALDDLPPASPARERIDDIDTAARHAAELCRQMLAYSGKAQSVVEPIDLNQTVRETAHLLEASISKKITLRYDLADDLPAIEASATQIRQVLVNLVTNAAEAIGDESGVISITANTMEHDRADPEMHYLCEQLHADVCICLEIYDTGCGMDEETVEKVFDPFFSTKFAGRGLGLAAVQGIVRGHRGAIAVDSEPGRGTTFRVLLPGLGERARAAKAEPAAAKDWCGGGTVLVVDDEEMVREVVRHMLKKVGFSVMTAADGHEAVELYRQHSSEIVCVILDLTMPQMGGEETFRELRRIRDDVPVIVYSGYGEREVVSRFAGARALGFIEKPFQSMQLVRKLREALTADKRRSNPSL
jgi:PAS domain S-box-containing protein